MPQFNATDAIFFGFRVVKRDPVLIAALIGLTTIVAVAGSQLIAPELVALLEGVERLAELNANAEPQRAFAEMVSVYGGFFGAPSVFAYLVITGVIWFACQGAILRALVRDERSGWFLGIQLGADELRAFVAWVLVKLAMFATYLGVLIAGVIVVGVLGALNAALGAFASFLVLLGGFLPIFLIGSRFCAAAPASIGERKFIIFGSWRLTQANMWGLTGAHLILFFLVGVMAWMVMFIITGFLVPEATSLSQGGTSLNTLEDPAAALRTPGYVFVTMLSAVLEVVRIVAWSGVGAYAYRMLGAQVGYANAHPPSDPGGAPTRFEP